MKKDIKEINSFTRQLDVTVEWDAIAAEYQKEFNRARSKYNMSGFRRGKVPEEIVKKNLGSVINSISKKFNGAGGGDKRKSAAVIPQKYFENFLNELDSNL